MTSEDIYCRICGEPCNIYGIFHGDMSDVERGIFLLGYGCPCCGKDKPKKIMDELLNELKKQ